MLGRMGEERYQSRLSKYPYVTKKRAGTKKWWLYGLIREMKENNKNNSDNLCQDGEANI
jgi:hypothetical protein